MTAHIALRQRKSPDATKALIIESETWYGMPVTPTFGTRSKVVRISVALPGAPSFEVFAPTSSYPDLLSVVLGASIRHTLCTCTHSGCRCGIILVSLLASCRHFPEAVAKRAKQVKTILGESAASSNSNLGMCVYLEQFCGR